MKLVPIFLICLISTILIGLIFYVYSTIKKYAKSKEIKKWKRIKAIISQNKIVDVDTGDGTTTMLQIVYKYEICGTAYSNLIYCDIDNKQKLNKPFTFYKPEDKLTIVYNPFNHGESYPSSYNFEDILINLQGLYLIILILIFFLLINIGELFDWF